MCIFVALWRKKQRTPFLLKNKYLSLQAKMDDRVHL